MEYHSIISVCDFFSDTPSYILSRIKLSFVGKDPMNVGWIKKPMKHPLDPHKMIGGFSTLDPHSRKFRNAEKLGSFHPAPPSCELGVAAPNLGKAGVHNHAACGFWGRPVLTNTMDF